MRSRGGAGRGAREECLLAEMEGKTDSKRERSPVVETNAQKGVREEET